MTVLARPRRPWDRTPAGEREYFELLGPGLVVVLPPRRPGRSGSTEWLPPTGGGWIHVGADGHIRAFTGKAEVGQGTRTALSLVVAEELRVSLDRVALVMADTDLCPWDMGTFGSRSMPDAALTLRTTAAGAREALVGLAAERAGRPPSELEVLDGTVGVRGGSSFVPYGELVRDRNRVVVASADGPLTPPTRWTRAGHPAIDPEARDVVTGGRVYVSDLRRPGMLFGAVLRPPRYGSHLVDAELDAARRRPGTTVVREEGFVGVAASTPAGAKAALADVRARWRDDPQPTGREVEAYLRTHPRKEDDWDMDERIVGDVEAALVAAPVRLEATYRTAYIAHVPLETRCAVAEWEGTRVTIWVGTQTPFPARDEVAEALNLPVEAVRIIVPPTGSGFGGKHGGEVAIEAARLARAAGRPVRVGFSREEEFRFGHFRPMSIVDVRAGAEKDGRLTAWSFHNINGGAAAMSPPYRIPHQRVDNALSTSPLPQGPYRSLAAAANNFARESAIDEIAHRVGVDPLVYRERILDDERLTAVLRRAAERAHWSDRGRRPGKGFGLAVGLEKGSRVATVAEVTVAGDRRLSVDRLSVAFEAGAIVNPDNLRSQVEGAVVMGLGGALFEAIRFDRGIVENPRLSEYRVPRFSDLPQVNVELLDRPDLPPAGAGETPLIAVAPALANAIFDATGVRLRSLPLVPDGIVPEVPAG